MRYLLSLMLVATFVCQEVYSTWGFSIQRCENKEVICYIHLLRGGVFCKFKEQEQWLESLCVG